MAGAIRLMLIAALLPLFAFGPAVRSAIPGALAGTELCGGKSAPQAVASPIAPARVATPAPAGSDELKPVADVPLPGGASRFDYQSFDPGSGRLYIAHMGADQLIVFDTASRKVVGTIDNLPTITGVLVVPQLGRVYASIAGDHQLAVIDAQSLSVVARLGQIEFPDGLAYVPQTRQVFVSDESGGGEFVIDARTDTVATTIDIGGEAGNTQFDPGSGCILVAVQDRTQLVSVDPVSLKVVGRYDLGSGCTGPHGFTLDPTARLAFVSCEDNAKLLVVDLTTMHVEATHDVGDSPDVLAFDPGLAWLYVASEAGVVSVFAEAQSDVSLIGEYHAPHAHTVAVVPSTHLIYLPLENIEGRPVLRIMKPETG